MGQLFDIIRQLVADEKYAVGQHASERLEERGIMEWQAVVGLDDGELLVERPRYEAEPSGRSPRKPAGWYRVQGRLVSPARHWRCEVGHRPFF